MKLKKQQMIIVGVILIALILVVSLAVILNPGTGDGSNNSNNNGNGDGANGDTNGNGDGDDDGDNGDSSQLNGNWVNMSSNIPDSNLLLTDVFFINENEGWITTSGANKIFHTKDGGLTFETQTTLQPTNAICMLNENTGFAGGQSGAVFYTNNGGENWNLINNFLPSTIRGMSFPPGSDTGFICGDSGWVGKINATEIFDMEKLVNSNLYAISFPVKNEGWLCGGSIIRHYVNGVWTADQNYAYGGYNAIHFIYASHGWAAGDSGIIIHTTDGYNWAKQMDNVGTFDGLFFLDELNGWALNFRVMSTNDGGNTWNTDSSTILGVALTSAFFVSPTQGFVVGAQSTFLKYVGEE